MVDPQHHREHALHVLRRLHEAGHQALFAGGCVRDQLLGREPKDYDVATNATPAEVRELFGKRHTLAIGAAFGVVAVIGSRTAGLVEVATFRRDATYSDGRHPDAVVFSSAEEDAQRRDFTINGLFYDPLDDQVIDYVGGQEDLRRGVVRAIGDARARFAEDKLRMIRAVRFAATFDFALDATTAAAVEEMAATIHVVSIERVAEELRKMLVHSSRGRALELLGHTRLLAEILPELLPLWHASTASSPWQHLRAVLDGLRQPQFPLALAVVLHVLIEDPARPGEPVAAPQRAIGVALASAVCERWRLSNKAQERVCWLLGHHGALRAAAAQPWSRLQRLLIADGIADLIALDEAEAQAVGGETARQGARDAEFCRRALALPPEKLDPAPLVTGDDLAAHGVPKGPVYKWLLEQVRDAQLDREVATRDEALTLVDRLLENRPRSADDS